MNQKIFETKNFWVETQAEPFVSREEGGHLRIMTHLEVSDRTKLSPEQAIEYIKLSMMVGEALKTGLAKRDIDIGLINYQEMGNWSALKPGGPRMHMHIFGRAKNATKQKYGEAVKLPFRETGFYNGFKPLSKEDVAEIVQVLNKLAGSEKYKTF